MTGHSADTHRRTREKQAANAEEYHHPAEKIAHLESLPSELIDGDILEVFPGQGNLTAWYSTKGMTHTLEGNSFNSIYEWRARGCKFDVIDIDSYGNPDLFFPVVFEMMKQQCLLVFTFPIVGVNCLNGINEQHYITFWRSDRPTIGDITGVLTDLALRNWYLPQLLSVRKIKRIWRFAFLCRREKATEMCNVRNRAEPVVCRTRKRLYE